MSGRTKYLVVAIYEDNHQRYATSVEANDTDEAEALAQDEARDSNLEVGSDTPLIIAGVIDTTTGLVVA